MVRTVSANTGIWSRQLSFGWAFMSDARVHVLLLSICCSSKEHQKKFVHVVLMQCKWVIKLYHSSSQNTQFPLLHLLFYRKSSNLQLTKMYIASYKKSNVLRIFDSVSLNFVIKILSLQKAKLVKFCFIHKLWSKSPLTFQLLTSTTTWEFVLRFLSLSASCFLYFFLS